MLTFDVAMPLTLFLVTLAALLLSKRVEVKLKATLEEREFRSRDIVLFVALIVVAVSTIAFVPSMALITLFMISYGTLLFTFSYFFSATSSRKALFLIVVFLVSSLIVGLVAVLGIFNGDSVYYWGLVAFGLAVFAFVALILELKTARSGGRWYLAVLPPALFIIVFFVFSPTPIWVPFLFDAFGIILAILITLYLSSLFTWKTTFVFAALITVMDFILVLVVPIMESTASHVVSLGLPALIVVPVVPLIFTNSPFLWGLAATWLGLGDFFFAGTLATQTYKRFDKKAAVLSAVTMSIAFGIFQLILLNTDFRALPGTLMIILGWVPVIAWKMISERKPKVT